MSSKIKAIIEGLLIDEWIEERNGCYRGTHTLSVIESGGLWYGWSRISAIHTENNWYGRELCTCSNLDLRTDGFESPEEAAESLSAHFGLLAVANGHPVFKGGRNAA